MDVGVNASFLGEYRHNLDAKKRLIIPAKFRDSLSDTFYVTKGQDGCLAVYTQEGWKERLQEIAKLPRTTLKARQYVRSITSKAMDCTLDTQGRLQLPQYLIQIANIEKACVIVGVDTYFEIWAEDKWDSFDAIANESFDDDAEELTGYLR